MTCTPCSPETRAICPQPGCAEHGCMYARKARAEAEREAAKDSQPPMIQQMNAMFQQIFGA